MFKNPERKGEAIAFLELSIWSLFPVLAVLSFTKLPSIVSLLWCTAFSSVFFLIVITIRNSWSDFKKPLLWKAAIIGSLCINVIFYGLYFWGLTMTSAGNGSIISLFEIFTSFIFFNILKKEYMSKDRLIGAAFMVLGAAIVLLPNMNGINKGDFLIFFATFFCPIGNYFVQKARHVSSGESIMFLRSIIAVPFLLLLTFFLHIQISISDIQTSFLFLFLNGFILFGFSKILWVEEIRYISVTKALALSSFGPLLTVLFAWIFIDQAPTVWQLFSFIPFFVGILLLTDQLKFTSKLS